MKRGLLKTIFIYFNFEGLGEVTCFTGTDISSPCWNGGVGMPRLSCPCGGSIGWSLKSRVTSCSVMFLPCLCLAFTNCSRSLINKDLRDVLSHPIKGLSLFSPLLESKNFSTYFWKCLLLVPFVSKRLILLPSCRKFPHSFVREGIHPVPCCFRRSGLGWAMRCARHRTGLKGLFWTGLGKQVKTENDRETGCMTAGLYQSFLPDPLSSAVTEAFSRRQNWSCLPVAWGMKADTLLFPGRHFKLSQGSHLPLFEPQL